MSSCATALAFRRSRCAAAPAARVPRSTAPSFQPRLKASAIDTFMPWPALALCVWQASPAMNTRGGRRAAASSKRSQSRWPISYTDHQPTSFTSSVYGCRMRFATVASVSGVTLRSSSVAGLDLVELDVERGRGSRPRAG